MVSGRWSIDWNEQPREQTVLRLRNEVKSDPLIVEVERYIVKGVDRQVHADCQLPSKAKIPHRIPRQAVVGPRDADGYSSQGNLEVRECHPFAARLLFSGNGDRNHAYLRRARRRSCIQLARASTTSKGCPIKCADRPSSRRVGLENVDVIRLRHCPLL